MVKLWVLFLKWQKPLYIGSSRWMEKKMWNICWTGATLLRGLKGVSMWNIGLQGSAKPRKEPNWALFPQCFDKGWDMLLTSRCQWRLLRCFTPRICWDKELWCEESSKSGCFFLEGWWGKMIWSWDSFKQVKLSKTRYFFRPPWWVSVERTMVEWTRYDVEAVMSFTQGSRLPVSTVHDNHVTMLG